MPVVPIDMPSETPIVLNCMGASPALETLSLTMLESDMRCILHGLPLYQTDDMPIWGLFRSASDMPVAYNIACEAPCDLGCVIFRETLLRPGGRSSADGA